jgi:hypothetical protein
MKKLLILAIIQILISLNLYSQTFKNTYLGVEYLGYKGVFFKLVDNPIFGLDFSFYNDLKYCQKQFDINVIYPSKNAYTTSKDSLINRIFLVEDIIDKNGKSIIVQSLGEPPIFKLIDTLNKQIIYYKYNDKSSSSFPFLTTPIKINLDAICKNIERKVDDFTNEVKINSPLSENYKMCDMIIYKDIKNGKSVYTLSLTAYGSTANVGGKGVIILFEDGTKINKPTVEIDVEANSSNFEYSAYITLNLNDLKLLSTKKIDKYRLYIYDKVNGSFAEKFQYYVKCVIDKK